MLRTRTRGFGGRTTGTGCDSGGAHNNAAVRTKATTAATITSSPPESRVASYGARCGTPPTVLDVRFAHRTYHVVGTRKRSPRRAGTCVPTTRWAPWARKIAPGRATCARRSRLRVFRGERAIPEFSPSTLEAESQREAPAGRRTSRSEMFWVALVAVSVGALFVFLASAHGAFGAARNDDWSYYRISFNFARTHRFRMDGWAAEMLVGHTLLAWPLIAAFGDSIRALQLLVVTTGVVAIVCCYALIRRFLSPLWSGVSCLTLIVGPVFASLAVSYMTDVTAFAAEALTLVLGVRAFEASSRSHTRWWLGAAAARTLR